MKSTKGKSEQEQEKRTPSLNTEYGHRVIFKAMGFTSEELSLPRIDVVNSWSEQSPGHVHLRAVSEGVKAEVEPLDSDVIRSIENPVWPEGALAILKGNLAPRGAVTRHTVVDNKELLTKVFTAHVFDSLFDGL